MTKGRKKESKNSNAGQETGEVDCIKNETLLDGLLQCRCSQVRPRD